MSNVSLDLDQLATVTGGASMPRSQAELRACVNNSYFTGETDRRLGQLPTTPQSYEARSMEACSAGIDELRNK